jgi:hypothetical protein
MKRFAYILVCATLISLPLNAMFPEKPGDGKRLFGLTTIVGTGYFLATKNAPYTFPDLAVGATLFTGGCLLATDQEDKALKSLREATTWVKAEVDKHIKEYRKRQERLRTEESKMQESREPVERLRQEERPESKHSLSPEPVERVIMQKQVPPEIPALAPNTLVRRFLKLRNDVVSLDNESEIYYAQYEDANKPYRDLDGDIKALCVNCNAVFSSLTRSTDSDVLTAISSHIDTLTTRHGDLKTTLTRLKDNNKNKPKKLTSDQLARYLRHDSLPTQEQIKALLG